MIKQIVGIHDICIGDTKKMPEDSAQLLELSRDMTLELYGDIIAAIETDTHEPGEDLFERRWDVAELLPLR
jgi:hypothetical protein